MAKKKHKNRIKDIKAVFEIVKLSAVIELYTDINPTGGIYHSLNRKSGRNRSLKDDEKVKIKAALENLSSDLQEIANSDELKIEANDKV